MFRKQQSNLSLSLLIAAAVLLAGGKGQADVSLQAAVGYSVIGQISAEPLAKVQAMPLSLALNYEDAFFKISRYMVGLILQHQFISYVQDTASFSGTNLLAGVSLGWNLMTFKNGFLRLEGSYYPYNSFAVTSESKASVNGAEYSHSTLTTLSGPGATEVKVSFMKDQTGGQFNKYERLRYGVTMAQLLQPFTKSEVRIATSEPTLAPRSKVTSDITQSLSLTSLFFVAGFAF